MAKVKRDYGVVDISSWNFPDIEISTNKIVKEISKVIKYQFEETPPEIFLDVYGDPSGRLKIKVNIPISPTEDGITYSVNLQNLVKEVISHDVQKEMYLWMVKEFRRTANMLERASKNGKVHEIGESQCTSAIKPPRNIRG